MDQDHELELLRARVAALESERLPKVDKASRRRDRRQVVGGLGLFAIAVLIGGIASASALAGSNTVFTDDIVDGQVTSADIKAAAVSGSKIRPDAVSGSKILNSSITGSDIGIGAVKGSDIAVGTVTHVNIGDGSVTGTDIANRTLTGSKIDFGSVTNSEIDLIAVPNTVDPESDSVFVGEATCLGDGEYTAIGGYGSIEDEQGAFLPLMSTGSVGIDQDTWQMTWGSEAGLVNPENMVVVALCLHK